MSSSTRRPLTGTSKDGNRRKYVEAKEKQLLIVKECLEGIIKLGTELINSSKQPTKDAAEAAYDEFKELAASATIKTKEYLKEFFDESGKIIDYVFSWIVDAIKNLAQSLSDLVVRIDYGYSKTWDRVKAYRGVETDYDEQTPVYASEYRAVAHAAHHMRDSDPELKLKHGKSSIHKEEYTDHDKHELLIFAHQMKSNMLAERVQNADPEHREAYAQALEQHEMSAQSLKGLFNKATDKARSAKDKIRQSITGKSGRSSTEHSERREQKEAESNARKLRSKLAQVRTDLDVLTRRAEALAETSQLTSMDDASTVKEKADAVAAHQQAEIQKSKKARELADLEKKARITKLDGEFGSKMSLEDSRSLFNKMHQLTLE